MQQITQHQRMMSIDSGRRRQLDQLRLAVRPDEGLHPEMSLVDCLCLVHVRDA